MQPEGSNAAIGARLRLGEVFVHTQRRLEI